MRNLLLIIVCLFFYITENVKSNDGVQSISQSGSSAYLFISLKDCSSCNSGRISEIIKLFEKSTESLKEYHFIVKEKITKNELKLLNKKYSTNKIIGSKEIKNSNDFNIRSTPYILIINADNKIVLEGNLLNIKFKTISSLLSITQSLKKSKSIKLINQSDILNIEKVHLNFKDYSLYILDDVQDKIFIINLLDGNSEILYSLNASIDYLNDSNFKKIVSKFEKPKATIESFIPDIENDKIINIFIKAYTTKIEIKKEDTTIYFIPKTLVLKYNTITKFEKVYTGISSNEISLDYNTIFIDNKNYYVVGRNIPKCNNFPYFEVADSTYIIFQFGLKFDSCKNMLLIKTIIDSTRENFFSFFQSEVISSGNKYILYNSLNYSFFSFKINNDGISLIDKINPHGTLKKYFDEIKNLNLTPKIIIENPDHFKIKSDFVLINMISTDDKVWVLLTEKNKNEYVIGKKIQIYNTDGQFLKEFSLDLLEDEKLIETKLLYCDNKRISLLSKYEDDGWFITEYIIK